MPGTVLGRLWAVLEAAVAPSRAEQTQLEVQRLHSRLSDHAREIAQLRSRMQEFENDGAWAAEEHHGSR